MILPYHHKMPKMSDSVFIAPNAVVSGDVEIGDESSIWFGTVIRGDVAPTRIGNRVNIQDLTMLHQSPNNTLLIEDDVTIGHQATIHSAVLRKNCLIGMGSLILDGAEIGGGAFIGAGSLVPPGKVIPPNVLAFGRPAKVVRPLNDHDLKEMARIRREYVEKGQAYKQVIENQKL
ncbi:carbonic anhydrase/acetyltransferase-like protein (isoleucine patch superfamily) [Scopulibacillus darangshiensis]|uniref:Carbonic anhydrase/acetyltransferase-like protein (Isoleucine patch superfamily) n=1 Tax=Scopulibacillus darangshiensis TaxID=442528 RepID=A0A4R2NWS7_9BACL|nr:gamma carbonic anhydrase family protein [Scopulibacillus darangshiensis]TCP26639.1 carbonic anhydrase/acetyltransferase-like protein (isoleucine patch superfamily) [Scopulibacillus darangshiensis]